ncbi:MAG: terminase [Tannerella sp.]|jgi:DNA-binding XRE family transcriptional regulator|nr:terminase [Tannerella sp.]
MAKKEMKDKCECARLYYMEGMLQKEIAAKVGVSQQSLSRWVDEGRWATLRAGVNITRPELVNKALGAVNMLLDRIYQSDDPQLIATLPDQLAKFASFIDKLDKKANVVSTIDVFIAFSKWVRHRATFDPEITPEFISLLDKYQDLYINENMSKK